MILKTSNPQIMCSKLDWTLDTCFLILDQKLDCYNKLMLKFNYRKLLWIGLENIKFDLIKKGRLNKK